MENHWILHRGVCSVFKPAFWLPCGEGVTRATGDLDGNSLGTGGGGCGRQMEPGYRTGSNPSPLLWFGVRQGLSLWRPGMGT